MTFMLADNEFPMLGLWPFPFDLYVMLSVIRCWRAISSGMYRKPKRAVSKGQSPVLVIIIISWGLKETFIDLLSASTVPPRPLDI